MTGKLTLHIVSPNGKTNRELVCDSVRLCICDGQKGRNGGSYGIHPGHTKSIFALAPGSITAFSEDTAPVEIPINGGFASVDRNKVTIISE